MHKDSLSVVAVGDVHCARSSAGTLHTLFSQIAETADIVLLCGDLTDYGLPEEAHVLLKEMSPLGVGKLPVVAVLGNHDYESGKQEEVRKILSDGGIRVLDGDTFEYNGVGFVGVKGFGGGFGRRMLEPWGESAIKTFVRESINESLKLETGLARLHTDSKFVLLHYAPIQETVEGEPCETFPFLGSSRLEDPINRYRASAVFHGHAHLGALEGTTRDGIPVFNVSAPLLKKHFPDQPTFRIMTVKIPTAAESEKALAEN